MTLLIHPDVVESFLHYNSGKKLLESKILKHEPT